MNRRMILMGSAVLVFACGAMVGYAATMISVFPMPQGHIFSEAPNPMPYGNDSPATRAHLSLYHDMSLLHVQTWRYELIVTNAGGQKIGGAVFSPQQVGGIYSLEHDGALTWDNDAWGVTASIGDFSYHCQLDRSRL